MAWHDEWDCIGPELARLDMLDSRDLKTAKGTTAPPPAIGECPQCSIMAFSLAAAHDRIKNLEADVRRLSGPVGIDTAMLNQQ